MLAVRNSYDQAGRLIRQESGTLAAVPPENVAPADWTGFTSASSTETQYAQNRKIRAFVREAPSSGSGQAGPVRALTEYSYDSRGRLDCTATRMNPAAFAFTGTPDACVPGAEGSFGPDRIARNFYDAAGQRLQVRVGVGTSVEGTQATWAYGLNGQITTMIDGNGNRAELRYDGHLRQDRWTFPSATRAAAFNDATQASALASAGSVNAADYEQYGYDAAGNRTSLRKRDGSTLTFQYDNLNRMILKVVPERAGLAATHTRDVYYGYDLRNAQLYARFDSATGEGVTNAYDGFGRLTSSTLAMDGISRTIGRAYDDVNNRVALTHPDGAVFPYAYDVLGRLSVVYQGAALTVPLASFVYNAQGLPQSRVDGTGSSLSYSYDAVGRLAGIANSFNWSPPNGTLTFARNPAGQIISRSQSNDGYAWNGAYTVNRDYTTNGLNQYSAAGSASFSYDANGNLTSDGSANFTYDVENRLVGAGGSRTAALRYDPLGRLYEVVGATTTRFLYDGDALIGEYNLAGTMTDRYVHGSNAGADDPLVWYGQGTVYWLQADHQGSITAIANIDGNFSFANAYDEYGIPRAGNTGRFQYTGQAWLGDLGMYHYKARVYSPTLGRFLQNDPVGYEGGVNLYAYVGNDPINSTDPTGMLQCSGDRHCPAVHAAARQARRDALNARRELRGLARAIGHGDALTSRQTSLLATFERKFGADSGTPSQLNAAADHFGGVAAGIGTPGNGMQVAFGSTADARGGPAATSPDGRTLTIGPKFFGQEGGIGLGLSQSFVILHEGGHSSQAGALVDMPLSRGAPDGYGRTGRDGIRRSYGSRATDWMGPNTPSAAPLNVDSFACIANPNCGP